MFRIAATTALCRGGRRGELGYSNSHQTLTPTATTNSRMSGKINLRKSVQLKVCCVLEEGVGHGESRWMVGTRPLLLQCATQGGFSR